MKTGVSEKMVLLKETGWPWWSFSGVQIFCVWSRQAFDPDLCRLAAKSRWSPLNDSPAAAATMPAAQ